MPGIGMRPRLWRNRLGAEAPQGGLQEMEASLKRTFEQMQQGSAPGNSQGAGSSSQMFSDAALMAAYHASWMDPSSPRQLPRQRAAAAAAAVTVQRQQQQAHQQLISSPAHNDLLDPVTQHMGRADGSSYKWVAAYKRAGHKQLPRQLREFGWRLLHAGVKVGARRMLSAGRQAARQFVCPAQQCQQAAQLETLSHLFVECPVAAAVWQWFVQLWQQVQPGAVIPISSNLLLLDDFSSWAPPQDKQLMWTYLRLLLLESIWVVRSSSCSNGGATNSTADGSGSSAAAATSVQGSSSASYTAKAVACRFRSALQQQLQREWHRVAVDIRVGSGISLSWLGGRSPVIGDADFQRKWRGLYRRSRWGYDGRLLAKVCTADL